jgi:hypothetical protein
MDDRQKTRLAPTLMVGVAAASAAFIGGRYFQNLPIHSAEISREPDLSLDSIGLNKTLPEMVSEGVRLDRTSAGPGKTFNYFYSVLDDDQALAISRDPSRTRQIFLQLNERVCAMMPNYVNHGVVVKYHLRNRFGADLPSIIVDPAGCNSGENKK